MIHFFMLQVPNIKAARARLLHTAGLTTPEAIAELENAEVIYTILVKGDPAHSAAMI